jgi:hypothetical protein
VESLSRLLANARQLAVAAFCAVRVALTAAANAADAGSSAAKASDYAADADNHVAAAESTGLLTQKATEALAVHTRRFAQLASLQLDARAAAVQDLIRARDELSAYDSPAELS